MDFILCSLLHFIDLRVIFVPALRQDMVAGKTWSVDKGQELYRKIQLKYLGSKEAVIPAQLIYQSNSSFQAKLQLSGKLTRNSAYREWTHTELFLQP